MIHRKEKSLACQRLNKPARSFHAWKVFDQSQGKGQNVV
jgi:hypothetical protein